VERLRIYTGRGIFGFIGTMGCASGDMRECGDEEVLGWGRCGFFRLSEFGEGLTALEEAGRSG
jgi:hypothetical protein